MKREHIHLLELIHGLADEAVTDRRENPDNDDTPAVIGAHQDTLDKVALLITDLKAAYVYPQLAALLQSYDDTYADTQGTEYRKAHRALTAAWWFIENVPEDAPDRQDAYFALRSIVFQGM